MVWHGLGLVVGGYTLASETEHILIGSPHGNGGDFTILISDKYGEGDTLSMLHLFSLFQYDTLSTLLIRVTVVRNTGTAFLGCAEKSSDVCKAIFLPMRKPTLKTLKKMFIVMLAAPANRVQTVAEILNVWGCEPPLDQDRLASKDGMDIDFQLKGTAHLIIMWLQSKEPGNHLSITLWVRDVERSMQSTRQIYNSLVAAGAIEINNFIDIAEAVLSDVIPPPLQHYEYLSKLQDEEVSNE